MNVGGTAGTAEAGRSAAEDIERRRMPCAWAGAFSRSSAPRSSVCHGRRRNVEVEREPLPLEVATWVQWRKAGND